MSLEHSLIRLSENIRPSDDVKNRVRVRMFGRMDPLSLSAVRHQIIIPHTAQSTIFRRILASIVSPSEHTLRDVSATVFPSSTTQRSLRSTVLNMLGARSMTHVHGFLKWGVAFAAFLVLVRALPFVFLASPIKASLGIQLVPESSIALNTDGFWYDTTQVQLLEHETVLKTGDDGATVIVGDDGMIRLAPFTTLFVHILHEKGDEVSYLSSSLIEGKVWVLGLVPSFAKGIDVGTAGTLVSVKAGSVSIEAVNESRGSLLVFDRGATVRAGSHESIFVSGQRAVLENRTVSKAFPTSLRLLEDAWVLKNMQQDAVHRAEIAKQLTERLQSNAGILPTSVFYPAKRLAEQVDVFFALGKDSKNEKKLKQANTRLHEAVALLQDGHHEEARISMTEYQRSLVAMASDQSDNLVKSLIRQQIIDATSALPVTQNENDETIALFTQAVSELGTSLPDVDVEPQDVEAYLLVDRLIAIRYLLAEHRYQDAIIAYENIRSYIHNIIGTTSSVSSLLQKEVQSLLASVTLVLQKIPEEQSLLVSDLRTDIGQYLPKNEDAQLYVDEEELNARVDATIQRILLCRHPTSRYNQ